MTVGPAPGPAPPAPTGTPTEVAEVAGESDYRLSDSADLEKCHRHCHLGYQPTDHHDNSYPEAAGY